MHDFRTANIIDTIFQRVTDEAVITSTGFISREAFRHDRPRNFYMQGSLGMALAIGLGLAYARPDLKVIVISGDGACLMSLGTLALHKQLVNKGMKNLTHMIIDNNCHNSTGGQKTCSEYIDFTDVGPKYFTEVYKCIAGKSEAPRISLSCKDIKERFKHAIVCK